MARGPRTIPPRRPSRPCRAAWRSVRRCFAAGSATEYDVGALRAVLAVAAAERLDGRSALAPRGVGPRSGQNRNRASPGRRRAPRHQHDHQRSRVALRHRGARADGHRDGRPAAPTRRSRRARAQRRHVNAEHESGQRAGVLAALREIHDGRWERNLGTDGGRSLAWTGRLVIVGADYHGVGQGPRRDCDAGRSVRARPPGLHDRADVRRTPSVSQHGRRAPDAGRAGRGRGWRAGDGGRGPARRARRGRGRPDCGRGEPRDAEPHRRGVRLPRRRD